jgi:hypothetical protein
MSRNIIFVLDSWMYSVIKNLENMLLRSKLLREKDLYEIIET